MRPRRGLTLLEVLVYCALFTILAVVTMQALGNARVLRSNASDRLSLALIAQEQLDMARLVPREERRAGTREVSDADWPSSTTATITLAEGGPEGLWTLEVEVRRQSPEGRPSVRLATLVPAGGGP